LTETFQKEATEGKLRAAGICYDVLTVPPGKHQKQDAGLEHCLGETVDVFKPCVWTEGGNFQYGEIFAAKRTPQFLSQIPLMAANRFDSLAIGYIAVRNYSPTPDLSFPPAGSSWQRSNRCHRSDIHDVREAHAQLCDERPPIACVEDQRQFALQKSGCGILVDEAGRRRK
jgi:hypothetical protein